MNIYESYGEVCQDNKGMIPVLLIKDTSNNQRKLIRKYHDREFGKDGLLCVEVDSKGDVALKDMLFFAQNEQDALDAFRKKTGFVKAYNREHARGVDLELLCIDAEGVVHSSSYVPMLKVYCYNEANMAKILDIANSCIKKIDRAVVRGDLGENGVALIFAELRDATVSFSDQRHIREKMLNSVYSDVSSFFHTIRLDDMGGTNKENITKYITKKDDRLEYRKGESQVKF